MKKLLRIGSFVAVTVFATAAWLGAGDGKEVTISGEAKCAKCALDETDECQNVVEAMEDGKMVTYYLAQNDVSKAFHKNVCQSSAKVTATGMVEMKDGKHMLTASKIEKME